MTENAALNYQSTIQDHRITEEGIDGLSTAELDTFKVTIKRADPKTGSSGIFFDVYSTTFDRTETMKEVTPVGLTGCIQIVGGRPSISIGAMVDEDLDLVVTGNADASISVNDQSEVAHFDMHHRSISEEWANENLENARLAIADYELAKHLGYKPMGTEWDHPIENNQPITDTWITRIDGGIFKVMFCSELPLVESALLVADV